jgi:general secretion pathway protein D
MIRKTFLRWSLVGLASFSLLVAAPTAIAQAREDLRVDVSLKDADMILATQVLTKQTGIQFIVVPSSEPFPKITLSVLDVTAEEAIRYICQAAGATFRRDENGVYIISRGPLHGATEVEVAPIQPLVPKPKIGRKIRVLNADAEAVFNQLLFGEAESPTAAAEKIARFKAAGSGQSAQGAQMITRGMMNSVPVSTSGTQPLTGFESGSGILLPGEIAGQAGLGGLPGPGGQTGGGLPGGAPGGQTPGAGAQLQGGQGLVGDSIDFISYDPTDNSIVVRGTEEDIAELQRYITMFDVAPRQVVIRLEFITTTSNLDRALGFDFLYQRGPFSFGNVPGAFAGAGDIFLNWAQGNVAMRMRARLSEGFGQVVAAPLVRTLNNQPAVVQQQIVATLFINTVVSAGQGQLVIVPQAIQFPITTGIAVAPRINADDTITMFLSPSISDFGQPTPGPQGQQIPTTITQFVQVTARVKNGETIVLGGLTRKTDFSTRIRFPILSDIPIIGQFFQGRTRQQENAELLIFVTPTIVDEDGPGGP